jgi:hypothetical protein
MGSMGVFQRAYRKEGGRDFGIDTYHFNQSLFKKLFEG